MFSPTAKSPVAPEELPAKLEQTMGLGRNSWPLSAIRRWPTHSSSSSDGPQEEPGVRDALAEPVRLLPAARASAIPATISASSRRAAIYAARPDSSRNQVQCEIEWWIFWGRVAGGLNRNQQTDIYQRLSARSCCRAATRSSASTPACCGKCGAPPPAWNCCRSAPRRNWATRCVDKIRKGDFKESGLWCLSRLGARKLFYGPINLVVPAATAARWVTRS